MEKYAGITKEFVMVFLNVIFFHSEFYFMYISLHFFAGNNFEKLPFEKTSLMIYLMKSYVYHDTKCV